jgi:5-methylcytosine-specific restriction endonuclease McrA
MLMMPPEVERVAKHTDLDAMIQREDFGIEEQPYNLDLMSDFPISHLAKEAPVRKLLRKPDFQRETNRWTPDQVATFIASFVDSEVIPSLILWKAPRYIFVIDGGHRLSALRAWMEDDYGDRSISQDFYKTEISKVQKDVADRTRRLIEQRVGRYSTLISLVDSQSAPEAIRKRAQVLVTRALPLQWITGDAKVAETSFFKINSQGTPLDDTEKLLITNRHKPIAISARAILRAGSGHKYWSGFSPECVTATESVTQELYDHIFKPEAEEPLKTLELPLGGSVSPVDALALLIDFLGIAGTREKDGKAIDKYDDDLTGNQTVSVLENALKLLSRMAGNQSASLGLHPAVYFYNEKGKYSRFLFLGMTAVIQDKLRNNNSGFFKEFTVARQRLEQFLIDNKSLIGTILQNLSRQQRVPRMKDLFEFLVNRLKDRSSKVKIEDAISHLGLQGRVLDVRVTQTAARITDDTRSTLYVREAIKKALRCPVCNGLLDPSKSVSYNHIIPKRSGGTGDINNAQMAHPYCNSNKDELLKVVGLKRPKG